MSFISPEFVIFFSVVIPLYFLIRHRFRWILLLVVSYFFYAYGNIQYLPLIAFSTIVDYVAARMLGKTEQAQQRRLWLILSIVVNLGVLFIFKYANFASGSAVTVLQMLGLDANIQSLNWVLPIGISFYTFQSMSYTIDVYRGKIRPEHHFGIMATYVAFFPQLVAGPIERATNLLPQFSIRQHFEVDRTVEGLQRILWGFFKKVVIADRLAIYVNSVYNNVEDHTGLTLIVATIFFGFQIYCDFSAYSDIAIGTARILGFSLMENFRQPYFSQSVREFWARWHISLSTWFRDYVYIPLGGNRTTLRRNLINLMLVFLISGLWHGAGWNFVIWGGLHGIAVAFLAYTRHQNWRILMGQDVVQRLIRISLTFAFVMLAWVFFRANSLSDAQYILANLWVWDTNIDIVAPLSSALLPAITEWWLIWGLLIILLAVDMVDSRTGIHIALARTPLVLRWMIYYALGASVVFSGIYGTGAQQFIYFQF
jgi:alginate O-acetyltransferase complex protein AlgI